MSHGTIADMIVGIYKMQAFALLVGTVFAWTTAIVDFSRFYQVEGTLFKINDCLYPNPITTPCFYGAIAFAVALIWALALLKKEGEARRKSEKYLMIFLSSGTIFAWKSFARLAYNFYTALPGEGVGCSGAPVSNPFATPCFYGSVLFLLALVVSITIFVKDRASESTVFSNP